MNLIQVSKSSGKTERLIFITVLHFFFFLFFFARDGSIFPAGAQMSDDYMSPLNK